MHRTSWAPAPRHRPPARFLKLLPDRISLPNTDVKGRPLHAREPRYVPYLTPAEAQLYARLTSPDWTRSRRVEQERIPLAVASAAAERLLRAKRSLTQDAAG